MFGSAWKNLVSEVFDELEIDIDMKQLLSDGGKCIGRMCRKCPASLVRLHKLNANTKSKLHDAVKKIMEEDRWCQSRSSRQSRKRHLVLTSSDDESEALVQQPKSPNNSFSVRPRRKASISKAQHQSHEFSSAVGADGLSQSPDVAV